jgi:Bacterial extracellular solute-binding protein
LGRIAVESLKVLCLAAVAVGIIYFFFRGGDFTTLNPAPPELIDTRTSASDRIEICGPPTNATRAVAIEMVYGDDMRPWIEAANDAFLHLCPDIQVKITAVPDIAAADAIFAGELKPVLWAPTDELSVRYLEHRWKQRKDALPFRADRSTSLVESPLVVLIWQDRLRLLSGLLHEDHSNEGLWVRAPCALISRDPDVTGVPVEAMVPGTWFDWYRPFVTPLNVPPPVGGGRRRAAVAAPPLQPISDEPLPTLDEVKTWGRVKIGRARPTHDSAGAAALYLMAYDYALPPTERQALMPRPANGPPPGTDARRGGDEQLMRAFEKAFAENKTSFGKWLRRCEAGQEAPTAATPDVTLDMFDVGPSLYDAVVTYEHLALPLLKRVDAHADVLRKLIVLYPEPTLLARHPAVMFEASAAQKEAARLWLRFLLSKDMQERAIDVGFRPVNPEVTIRGYNEDSNQFLRLRRYGVLIQPHFVEAPRAGGSQIQELLTLWGEVTGRN